jgi:single-stranded-DNA-specific exonuclease
VAYKLAQALLAEGQGLAVARRLLEPHLDLVALGTVADLAALVGENRLLARLGLRQMNQGARLGLRALASAAGWASRAIDADSVGYVFAPRLNAAGRMGDARLGLELLTCQDQEEATRLAVALDAANRERQAATLEALRTARDGISRLPDLPAAIVLAGDYPAGIVGLIAGKLADEFSRPSFVIEMGETMSRGSARGPVSFDVLRALTGASDLLARFGGHAQAGGFAVATERLEDLRARLELAAMEQLGAEPVLPDLLLEARLRASQVGPELYQYLSLLEPFGSGNSRPLFLGSSLLVRDARVVGGSHLRLWLADESGSVAAIGFGMGTEEYAFARPGARVDCAFVVGRNERGGTVAYEMVLKGLRPAVARDVQ